MNFHRVNECLKLITLLVIILVISACSAKLVGVSDEHALVVSKWKGLATYAKVEHMNLPFIITAELGVSESSDQLILKNIKIKQRAANNEINLLDPSFTNKVICLPHCIHLTEYIHVTNETLLDNYFSTYEFNLFNFYGKFFLLTDTIQKLAHSTDHFDLYIAWLMAQQPQHNQLAEFVVYLNHSMTEQAYFEFINTPGNKFVHFFPKKIPHELIELEVSQPLENLNWDMINENSEIATWQANDINNNQNELSTIAFNKQSKLAIDVGDTVCSYSSNSFGAVYAVKGNKVIVQLIGLLKLKVDGQYITAAQGNIFSLNEPYQYFPLTGKKEFSIQDIARCQVIEKS